MVKEFRIIKLYCPNCGKVTRELYKITGRFEDYVFLETICLECNTVVKKGFKRGNHKEVR